MFTRLLANAGLPSDVAEITPLRGGRNNRVFRIRGGDSTYAAKIYFRDSADGRDRLGAEFGFLSYAHGTGMRAVPEPLLASVGEGIAFYEFVEGRTLAAAELTTDHVIAAAAFLRELNADSRRDRAKSLPTASAYGFSVEEHLNRIEARIERLRGLPMQTRIDTKLAGFIARLEGEWARLAAKLSGMPGATPGPLDPRDRCISPSDFGFHNALLRRSGEICFLDFEYAGWDDPAKMVCDFFSQPAVPVSLEHFDLFLREALSYSPRAELLAQRARGMLSVIRIEWCCILLNEFLPDAARRRGFAKQLPEPDIAKAAQLEKAEKSFTAYLGS